MSETIQLNAAERTVTGKKVAQLRREGKTPIVLYGPRSEPVALQVETKALQEVLFRSGTTHVIEVQIDGESAPRRAIARARQLHPTRLTPLHADFLEIDKEVKVTTKVPTRLTGAIPRVVTRNEARLQLLIESLEIRALPDDLPAEIQVDTSKLTRIGQIVRIRDLEPPDGVRIMADPDRAIGRMAALRRQMVIEEDVEDEDEDLEGEELEGAEAAEGASEDGGGGEG